MRLKVTARTMRILVLTTSAALLLPAVIEAVYVSPTAVFIDDRTRSTQIMIGNNGDTPEEATDELKFGFPDADSAGTPYIRFIDDPGPDSIRRPTGSAPSAARAARAPLAGRWSACWRGRPTACPTASTGPG